MNRFRFGKPRPTKVVPPAQWPGVIAICRNGCRLLWQSGIRARSLTYPQMEEGEANSDEPSAWARSPVCCRWRSATPP